MGKWIKGNILDLIQVGVLVGAAVVAFIAWLQSMPWYLALLGLLAAVVLVLFGMNQYEIRKERHRKTITKLSDKELEDTIRDWVDISAFHFQRQEPGDSVYFAFDVGIGDLGVHIERQRKDPMVIVLATGMSVGSNKTVVSQADWDRFGGQVSIEMARLGIQFRFPDFPKSFERIQLIETVILDDTLTGFYFRSRVMFVIRAMILVLEVFKECLRQIEKSTPDKSGSQP